MQDDWPEIPPFPSTIWQDLGAGGADVLRGALPSGEEACGKNVELVRVHFENVIGVRRIVAADGTGWRG